MDSVSQNISQGILLFHERSIILKKKRVRSQIRLDNFDLKELNQVSPLRTSPSI